MRENALKPEETAPLEAHLQASDDQPLIDIRSARERLAGVPEGSIAMDPEELLDSFSGSRNGSIQSGFILCAEGIRSLDLVRRLKERGRPEFSSVAGGFFAWRDAGLPVRNTTGLSDSDAQRYARHLVMPQVGPQGQQMLLQARILLVGLGGLNSPAALYLAAAGVGCIGLADHDTVEQSNLQRQVVHGETSLGDNKARSAGRRVADLNSGIETVIINSKVDRDNVQEIISDWDIVLDGTDNFEARYALNDACTRLSKPLVYGAVMRFQGQVSVFHGRPCFRCLLPEAPAPQDVPGCSEAGVLGVLPGIVGTLQASEALKLALNIGRPLKGRLLMIDALNMEFREARVAANPDCPVCAAT
jgi:molybdopterin/thiamine biosynthesis adenylyltransferase/rhodanese-related sulfurtransferase